MIKDLLFRLNIYAIEANQFLIISSKVFLGLTSIHQFISSLSKSLLRPSVISTSIVDKPSLHSRESELLKLLTRAISSQDAVALGVLWNFKEFVFFIRVAITIVGRINHLTVLHCERVAPEGRALTL